MPRRPPQYAKSDFERILIDDFRGGMNVTDAEVALPPNQFRSVYNMYFNRQGQLYSRPPYRPLSFAAAPTDKRVKVSDYTKQLDTSTAITNQGGSPNRVRIPCIDHGFLVNDSVTIAGTEHYNGTHAVKAKTNDNFDIESAHVAETPVVDSVVAFTIEYNPKTIENYYTFRETISNWAYGDEMQVVSGLFKARDATHVDRYFVVIYNTSTAAWESIWSSSSATTVSVCIYKINKAIDLLLFPNNNNPERFVPANWASGGATGLTDLGLAAPASDAFSVAYVETTASTGWTANTAGDLIYYKFSYFYDETGTSTKYGESVTTALDDDAEPNAEKFHTVDSTAVSQVVLTFSDGAGTNIPLGVTRMRIYRAPLNIDEGPYQYLGEVVASTAPDGDGNGVFPTFTDNYAFGAEGAEDLAVGSNPSLSGSELKLVNVNTIGSYLIGYDANMDHKLIWCDAGFPDVWNPLNFDYLDTKGMYTVEFNRKIYAFTKESCYQKTEVEATAHKISNIGCIDGRTVMVTGKGIIWADYSTVYFANFVEHYGTDGDFPLDIGHNISRDIKRIDTGYPVSCAFIDRRYYINFTDGVFFNKKCYVYDVDINAWTQHSMQHTLLSRGDSKLFSLGKHEFGVNNEAHYIYEHDHRGTVSTAGASSYEGLDFHDYEFMVPAPVSWFKCDDALGTQNVIDSGTLGNDGTVGGASDTEDMDDSTDKHLTSCFDLSLDGGDQYFTAPNNASYTPADATRDLPFSVSVWVKTPATPSGTIQAIVCRYAVGASDEWILAYNAAGKVYFELHDIGNAAFMRVTLDSVLTADTWYHILATSIGDGRISATEGGLKLYINGALPAQTQATHAAYNKVSNAGIELSVGCLDGGGTPSNFWDARIDEIKIFTVCLTGEDISNLYGDVNTGISAYGGMKNIESNLTRAKILFSGEYRKTFFSSISYLVEGLYVNTNITLAGDNDRFSETVNFNSQLGTNAIDLYNARWDEARWSPNAANTVSDADYHGWVGYQEGSDVLHIKLNRRIKTENLKVSISNVDSRSVTMLGVALYYKSLPYVA